MEDSFAGMATEYQPTPEKQGHMKPKPKFVWDKEKGEKIRIKSKPDM
jgi:hypothetical protein